MTTPDDVREALNQFQNLAEAFGASELIDDKNGLTVADAQFRIIKILQVKIQ